MSYYTEINHKPKKPKFDDPSLKANILLQTHLSRNTIREDLDYDRSLVLPIAIKLIQALVDSISYNEWLKPAILTMKLSQMIIQGMWLSDSVFKQLPYFDDQLIEKANKLGIKTIDDLMEMEDDDRLSLLSGLNESQLNKLAEACNRYPNLVFDAKCGTNRLKEDEEVTITISLERDGHDEEELDEVFSEFYPKRKDEFWWVVVGEPGRNKLHTIKRVNFVQKLETVLKFDASEVGKHDVIVYLICDSYIGCDQESELISFDVEPADEE